jgi:endo-1,4-beta-xylanase
MPRFMLAATMAASASAASLRELADENNIYIGTAVNWLRLADESEPEYAATVAAEYNYITAENACKWAFIEGQGGQDEFERCDFVTDWAYDHDMGYRGHTLVWGRGNPDWLEEGDFSPAEKRDILEGYIRNITTRYKGKVQAWDVVNEAVCDGNAESENCGWSDRYNTFVKRHVWWPDVEDYIDLAFNIAKEVDPDAVLFYNEYKFESSWGWQAGKAERTYNLVKSLVDRGIPVEGIGTQTHTWLEEVQYNTTDYLSGVRANLGRYSSELNLNIHFTEFDVKCSNNQGDAPCDVWGPEEEEAQAVMYSEMLKICIDLPTCDCFESWGFTDKFSFADSANYERHPFPFDAEYKPKPAYYRMQDVLNEHVAGAGTCAVDNAFDFPTEWNACVADGGRCNAGSEDDCADGEWVASACGDGCGCCVPSLAPPAGNLPGQGTCNPQNAEDQPFVWNKCVSEGGLCHAAEEDCGNGEWLLPASDFCGTGCGCCIYPM